MKNFFVLLFIFIVSAAFAQNLPDNGNTENIYVYLFPANGGSDEEQEFFNLNLGTEIVGAGYMLAETQADSDFYMEPTVHDEEDPHFLSVSLFQTDSAREIITLSWDYENLESMYTWNPYIIFQLMSNAPKTRTREREEKEPSPMDSNSWQNKWLWVGPVAAFGFAYNDAASARGFNGSFLNLNLMVDVDFLNFMGISLGFGYIWRYPLVIIDNAKYHEEVGNFVAPVLVRYIFKLPNLMIEPYLGAQLNFSTKFKYGPSGPIPTIIGGADLNWKAFQGVISTGARVGYGYEHLSLALTAGYKFSFLTRESKKKKEPQPAR
ncbi:MAG: hypothetical protein LBT16_09425 [Treponema sp.]|jgi:hypothetical protein|nr:hypothetical protein [Treponema sp.]